MPYLRLTADRRGVEHTYLLHTPAPGEKTQVLYWYRTAPGLRMGRTALDDAAMRSLEEQYPDIDFDWQYILDMGAMTPVEVEAPLPPRKRKPAPPRPPADADVESDQPPTPNAAVTADSPRPEATGEYEARRPASSPVADAPMGPDLLGELLGRGIAAGMRARHAELEALVEGAAADPSVKAGWRERLAALDPDGWESPEAVLAGIGAVEAGIESLRRTVEQASAAT